MVLSTVKTTLNNNLVSDIKVNDEGKLVVTKGGADTVLPFSNIKKFFFFGDDISAINIVKTVRASVQTIAGFLYLKGGGEYTADRGIYISVDVTGLSYILIAGVGSTSDGGAMYWFINMDGATSVPAKYNTLIDVSRLDGEQVLKIYPHPSQGAGTVAFLTGIVAF